MLITDVPGIRVGHWTDTAAGTGCTVVLAPPGGARAGVDVRGSAPGSREIELLRPGMLVDRVDALALCGGSAFGLGAADGVMRYLRERGAGFPVGRLRIPIVPAAVVFDQSAAEAGKAPSADAGYAAALEAERGAPCVEGRVGAGTGATVGKILGFERRSPGGLGSSARAAPGGAMVGALAVVNAVGDVMAADGSVLAGARDDAGAFAGAWSWLLERPPPAPVEPGAATTLGVVATDALLSREQCQKLAQVAHDALAQTIRPVHTMFDGDVVFALSVGDTPADLTNVCVAAVESLDLAIRRAVSVGASD
ncbi:MAG: P1 family peptidase [Candidatus Dormibacteraeota bacterium]|nr:P1 family peptidase [Candidatus Dormibacteraeota bacterium]